MYSSQSTQALLPCICLLFICFFLLHVFAILRVFGLQLWNLVILPCSFSWWGYCLWRTVDEIKIMLISSRHFCISSMKSGEDISGLKSQPFLSVDKWLWFQIFICRFLENESDRGANLFVAGDILGSSINNLDDLLRMPYGCGEQNMVNFAPNIFVMKYLQTVNQITSAIKSKAENFMIAGNNRRCFCKHIVYSSLVKPGPNRRASRRKFASMRTDFMAKRIRKAARKSQKVNFTHIQLTCDQLVSTCVGWPNGEKL